MLNLQIMYTEGSQMDLELWEHFHGNLNHMLHAVVLSVSGLRIEELQNANEKDLESLKRALLPKSRNNVDVAELIQSVATILESNEVEAPTIMQEYIIYRVHTIFCEAAIESDSNMIIPFLRRQELLQSYIAQLAEYEDDWTKEEIREYAEDLVYQVEDVNRWMDLLFDDTDYKLLDSPLVSDLEKLPPEFGIRL